MTSWLDFAIVYFALGAPFGVLRITAKRNVSAFAFVRSVSGFLLWPIVALRNGARFLAEARTSVRASATSQDLSERNDLELQRIEIEAALFPEGAFSASAAKRDELYAFREAFFRYHGLKEASAQLTTHSAQALGLHSPFTTHNSPSTRAACLSRRDRLKLEAQLASARRDLSGLTGSKPE